MRFSPLLSLSALSLSVFCSSSVFTQEPQASPELENESFTKPDFRASKDFNLALAHLQGANDHLTLINLERRIETWSDLSDEFFNSTIFQELMEEEAMLEETPKFDLSKSLDSLGIGSLTTYAKGVEKVKSTWITRSFLGMKGKPQGLLALGGKQNSPWQAKRIARKEDDLIIEFTLDAEHLGQWLLQSLEQLNETISDDLKEQLAQEADLESSALAYFLAYTDPSIFSEPVLPTGESILEAISKIGQPRLTLILNIPSSKDMTDLYETISEEEDFMTPLLEAGASLTLAIDQAQGIMELLAPALEQLDTAEENGLQITRFLDAQTREMNEFPEDMLAQLSYDPASKLALVEFGRPSTQAPGSIQDSADFAAATAPLPNQGMSLSWISADSINSLYQILNYAIAQEDEEAAEFFQVLSPLVSTIYGIPQENSQQGIASSSYWVEGGLANTSTSPIAPPDIPFAASAASFGTMATIAIPAATKALERARSAKNMSKAKNLATAIIVYQIDEGEYPDSLEDLFDRGALDEGGRELLSLEEDSIDQQWNYQKPAHNTGLDTVVLWAQTSEDEYLAATLSGSTLSLSKNEFEKLAKKQKLIEKKK